MKKFVVVFIVLALILVSIPASASPAKTVSLCVLDINMTEAQVTKQGWSWIEPNYNVKAASLHGVVYQNGVNKSFHGDLVSPASGYNVIPTGISGVEVRLGSDGHLYVANASSSYYADIGINGIEMLFPEGRCGHY
jgi:hypothetical protein